MEYWLIFFVIVDWENVEDVGIDEIGFVWLIGIGRDGLIVVFEERDFWVFLSKGDWSWWFKLERKLKLGMEKRLIWLGWFVLVR